MVGSGYAGALTVSAMISLAGMLVMFDAPAGRNPQTAAAVFPPWWSAAEAFAAAGSAGEVARAGALSSILIVHSKEPALADRLRKAGALLVLDPERLALCAQSTVQGDANE